MGDFIAEKTISELVKQGISPLKANITILGLSFKENCPDIRNTKVVTILKRLQHYDCNLNVSDPWVISEEAIAQYDIELKTLKSIQNQDAVIVAVAHDEYLALLSSDWERMLKPQGVLIDVKSIFKKDYFLNTGIRHWAL